MGRYYSTGTGRGGKFGFGCQSSEEPETFFHMTPTGITYECGEEEEIKEKLDEIYDKANIPKDARIYKLGGGDNDNEYDEVYNKYHKYFFTKADDGQFSGRDGIETEVFPEAHLYSARLWLGLIIITDIKEDGYCTLDAEL